MSLTNRILSAIHAVYQQEQRGATAVRSAADDEVIGTPLLHGSVQFASDSKRLQEDYPLQGVGGGQPAEFPYDLGFSEIHIEMLVEDLFEQVLAMGVGSAGL